LLQITSDDPKKPSKVKQSGPAESSNYLVHSRFNSQDRNLKEIHHETVGLSHKRLMCQAHCRGNPSVEVSLISIWIHFIPKCTTRSPIAALRRVNRSRRVSSADVYVVLEQPENVKYLYLPALLDATLRRLELMDGQTIDEAAVNGWLDEIYAGETLNSWQAEYDKSATRFESEILNSWSH